MYDTFLDASEEGQQTAVEKQGMLYFETVHYPRQDDPMNLGYLKVAISRTMWTGYAAAAPPGPISYGNEKHLEYLGTGAQSLRASTDRAIVGLFGGNLFELGQWLFGMEDFFSLLASEPDYSHRFLDSLTDIHIRNLEGFLKAVGPSICSDNALAVQAIEHCIC